MTYYLMNVGSLIGIFVILGLSYNLLLGYAGLFSIGHAAFFGVGAYATGVLMTDYESPFLVAILVAAALGGLLGILLSRPALRVAGLYLVLMTLGFQYVAVELFGLSDVTGGKVGLIGIPRPTIANYELGPEGMFVTAWILVALVTLLTRSWLASPYGRVLESLREDELAARSLGKRTRIAKVEAFAASSALAAVAGGLFACHLRFISPNEFGLDRSIEILAIVIIGGTGTFWGPYLGAFFVIGVPQALTFLDLSPTLLGEANLIIFSVLLLVILRFRPQGLAFVRRRSRSLEGKGGAVDDHDADKEAESSRRLVRLECRNVSIAFGGLKAVDEVTLSLEPGAITGLIGPNGAGKTTLFNILTGVLTPNSGTIMLDGKRLDGLPLESRAELGVVRSFQDMKLFGGMTCLQNLLIPATAPNEERLMSSAVRSRISSESRMKAAMAVLERLGLAESADVLAGDLSYAEQKRLMVGRLLASRADCFLLDEPMSGLDEKGRDAVMTILEELAQSGVTICLVEHSLSVIQRVCTRVAFLSEGRLIAEGPTDAIIDDPKLRAMYFGTAVES